MKKWLMIFGLVSLMFVMNACSKNNLPIETNMSERVADFSFTTQDNETFGLTELEGEWWIADFIFTNCRTVCLPMTSNMSILQDELKKENLDIQLVSFSVDPEHDTPEVLQKYGEQYDANFDNWHFLTGYDMQTIKELSIKSFRALIKEEEGSDQVMHDTRFFLVDPEGNIIHGYDGVSMDSIDEIIADVKKLEEEGLL